MSLAQVQHETRLRKRTQDVVEVAAEAYLRSDLRCGSPECSTCLPKAPCLPAQINHYVMPDSQTLEDFLDIFELPDFTGFIILTSVLREVIVLSFMLRQLDDLARQHACRPPRRAAMQT